MSYERDLIAAMAGGDGDAFEAKATVRAAVCQQITCPTPGCGRVMDVKDALVFENSKSEPFAVCCGKCAPVSRENIRKAAERLRVKGYAPGTMAARILSTKNGIELVLVPEATP